jgi:hypothetical protein
MIRLRPRTTIAVLAAVFTLFLVGHVLTIKGPSSFSFSLTDDEHLPAFDRFPDEHFNWTAPHPPDWLQPPASTAVHEPVVFRMAIISHPKEFDRRKAIRDYVLANVPKKEVRFDYYFFLGKTDKMAPIDGRNMTAEEINDEVQKEQKQHGDLFLIDMLESQRGLGEKRWRALKWVRPSMT